MTTLIGILNLTPDSFSDGGKYDAPDAAYSRAEALINDGAGVIDIGAESTRPNAIPLLPDEEWVRLSVMLPSIITLAHTRGVLVSVDTRHTKTAALAIEAGVDWINDVSYGASDALLHTVAESNVRYVAMHSLCVPANPTVILPRDRPVITQVMEGLQHFLIRLNGMGIDHHRIIIDGGLGFGKDAVQSLELLWEMPTLSTLGCDLLVGHSRKSLFSLICNDIAQRDALTLLASSYFLQKGAAYLRVHDVRAHALLKQQTTVCNV
jgi:dihydropteroate synthase